MVNKQNSSKVSCLDDEVVNLGDIASIIMGQSPSGKTYNAVGVGSPLLNGPTEFGAFYPTAIQWTSNPTKLCDNGDILVCVRGSSTGRMNVADQKYCIGRGLAAVRANSNISDQTYIRFHVERLASSILSQATGSTFPNIDKKRLEGLAIFCPPLSEQRKIATILSSVNNTIEKTEAIIKQTEKVKKGTMQQLLTKGIGHKKFKQTEVGEIPMEWMLTTLGEVFKVVQRPIKMNDEQEYQLVTVKRRQEGIVPRSILRGKNILVKSQFTIREGDFLISKRQIVHGACEIVPKYLDGAIVSNEYHVLESSDEYDLEYFRWYSRTNLLMKYFLLSSIGVHIEKMLFRVDDWFKRVVSLPPLEEQKKIARYLNSIQHSIDSNKEYLAQLQVLKQSLMQILLTGKLRVNVDGNTEVVV